MKILFAGANGEGHTPIDCQLLTEWIGLLGLERSSAAHEQHVVRHKVLMEGRSQRAVARELGLARVTVRKYLEQAVPARKMEAGPRARPVSCGAIDLRSA